MYEAGCTFFMLYTLPLCCHIQEDVCTDDGVVVRKKKVVVHMSLPNIHDEDSMSTPIRQRAMKFMVCVITSTKYVIF